MTNNKKHFQDTMPKLASASRNEVIRSVQSGMKAWENVGGYVAFSVAVKDVAKEYNTTSRKVEAFLGERTIDYLCNAFW